MKLLLFIKRFFRRKRDPNAILKRLEKIKIRMDRKLARLGRLKEKKGIKEATKKRIGEGINRLIEERKKIVETIKKLT